MEPKITNLRFLVVPVACTAALVLAPIVPSPGDFWLVLAVLIIGPGWGILKILFPNNSLTLPEGLFIIILSSIAIDTVIFAGLNALNVRLTPSIIKIAVLAVTYALMIVSIRNPFHNSSSIVPIDQPDWLSFVSGIILAIAAIAIILEPRKRFIYTYLSTITTSTASTVTPAMANSLALIGILVLLALLVVKELVGKIPDMRFQKLGRTLNLAIVPLLIAFVLILVVKVAELLK